MAKSGFGLKKFEKSEEIEQREIYCSRALPLHMHAYSYDPHFSRRVFGKLKFPRKWPSLCGQ
jgi:hypothetical protein